MNKPAKQHVLLLADTHHPATAVADHIKAITHSEQLQWHVENPIIQKTLSKLDLNHFAAIGIHYSVKPYSHYYLDKALLTALKNYRGCKFLFVQDEYAHAERIEQVMLELDIDILFTLVQQADVRRAYPDVRLSQVKMITVDTAYAPAPMSSQRKSISDRTTDIFYRSREFPYHLGHLGRERVVMADEVAKRAQQHDLNIDISIHEKDRLYGREWIETMSNARAVLGTESGASIWDHKGDIAKQLQRYLRKNRDGNYQTAHDAVLKPHEGNLVYSTISPRAYEAAALGTPMILHPGRYSDVLIENQHYIPLAKDFSNFDQVIATLKDTEYLQVLADRTYEQLIASGDYAADRLAAIVEQALLNAISQEQPVIAQQPVEQHILYTKQQYKKRNKIHYCLAEAKFVLKNFFNLLANRNHTEANRWRALYFGARRYFVYLFARAKS